MDLYIKYWNSTEKVCIHVKITEKLENLNVEEQLGGTAIDTTSRRVIIPDGKSIIVSELHSCLIANYVCTHVKLSNAYICYMNA